MDSEPETVNMREAVFSVVLLLLLSLFLQARANCSSDKVFSGPPKVAQVGFGVGDQSVKVLVDWADVVRADAKSCLDRLSLWYKSDNEGWVTQVEEGETSLEIEVESESEKDYAFTLVARSAGSDGALALGSPASRLTVFNCRGLSQSLHVKASLEQLSLEKVKVNWELEGRNMNLTIMHISRFSKLKGIFSRQC